MKAIKIFMLTNFILFTFVSCTSVNKKVYIKQPKLMKQSIRVAVLPLKDAPKAQNSGVMIADALTNELIKMSSWTLVERSQFDKVLSESELEMSGITSGDAVKIGNKLNTDYIIIGSVGRFESKNQLFIIPRTKINFNLRIIHVATGSIVGTVEYNRETNKYWGVGCCTGYYALILVLLLFAKDKNIQRDVSKASYDVVNTISKDVYNRSIPRSSGCL